MQKIILLSLLAIGISACKPKANVQSNVSNNNGEPTKNEKEVIPNQNVKGEVGIAFYNVENLFDTQDDPKTVDEEFTPDGKLKWTEDKYNIKLSNLAKVLSALDGGEGPEMFGLVEIENAKVVSDLLNQPALKKHNYRLVHHDSKDARGVDVAFCYDPAVFQHVADKAFTPNFSDKSKKSRDFLVVEGKVNGETVYMIVNHWPSRREGKEASEVFRVEEATHIKRVCDSILKKKPDALICMMGDFNDDPIDKSIATIIGAKAKSVDKKSFFNPMLALYNPDTEGSLEYEGKWNVFDQFIMNGNLANGKTKVQYVENSASIFHPEWLRVGYGKAKESPKRSVFAGKFRDDGYSDHFPVQMKWNLK